MHKMSKKKESFLAKYWVGCLVIFLMSFVLWDQLITYLNSYQRFERVNLFVVCDGIKEAKFLSKSERVIKDSSKTILDSKTYVYKESDREISTYYQKYGMSSDILILNNRDLDTLGSFVTNYFVPLDEVCDVTNYSTYEYEGLSYGIKVDSDDFTFASRLEFDSEKDYYILINKSSVNVGPYNEDSRTSNALLAFNSLLEHYKAVEAQDEEIL